MLVTTDFAPSDTMPPLHSVVLRVRRLGDGPTNAPLREQEVTLGARGEALPLKFSVFLATNPGEQVVVEAEAHTLASRLRPRAGGEGVGEPVTVARVITGFVEGEIRVVPMVLYRGCWDRRLLCSPEQTCGPSAECESARRDPNSLPRLDPDAGDPTDAFTPAVSRDAGTDASAMDASPPSVESMDAGVSDAGAADVTDAGSMDARWIEAGAADAGCLPRPTAQRTVVVTRGGGTFEPVDFDLAPSVEGAGGDGGAADAAASAVELVWAEREMTGLLVRGSTVELSGATPVITRMAPAFGSASFPGASALQFTRFPAGPLAVITHALGPMGRDVLSAVSLLDPFGLSAPFTLANWVPSSTEFRLANSASVGVGFDMMAPRAISCVGDDAAPFLACAYQRPGAGGSGSLPPELFAVSLPAPIVPRPRLVSMVYEGATLRFALELAGMTGVAVCAANVTLGSPVSVGPVSCERLMQTTGSVVPGSTSVQWIPGDACGGGWFGALVQQTMAGHLLRAGRLQGTAIEGLAPGRTVLATASARTAVSLRATGCEMLVAQGYDGTMDVSRLRLSDRRFSEALTLQVASARPIRMLPTSRRFGTGPEIHVGLVASEFPSRSVDLFTVPAVERCGPAM